MSIKRNGAIGGVVIVGAMALAGVVASLEINQIRFGGPIQVKNQQVSDLVADILPPPEYVIEPYLEATLLVNEPASLATRKVRLAELRKQFDDRLTYWQQADLDPSLKSALIDGSSAAAKEFWSELDEGLLPAIERGDADQLCAPGRKICRPSPENRYPGCIDGRVSKEAGRSEPCRVNRNDRLACRHRACGGGHADRWSVVHHASRIDAARRDRAGNGAPGRRRL